MDLRVGTFNLNNLFSRWNFTAVVDQLPADEQTVEYVFEVDADATDDDGEAVVRFRTFDGRLVGGKDPEDTRRVADRILAMDLDVLAVQEVENLPALQEFNERELDGLYDTVVLIEGNDHRLIDVALLAKLPLRRIQSNQTEVHPDAPDQRVFSRDLVGIEVWDPRRTRRLLTVYNTHLKSNFVPYWVRDVDAARQANDVLRFQQTQTVVRVIEREEDLDRYLVLGDLNQEPDHFSLTPLTRGPLDLVDALADLTESRPPPPARNPEDVPPGPRWTTRLTQAGAPDRYNLFDQIWASPDLAGRIRQAQVERRRTWTTSGSDHDPVWVELADL
ncbi:endonuclease/exonuclease/phosphatase family protein [Euzebya tangerina]|uniref:endonuclease/exonuclease/phosphatase family protein n=1 Tax=Euzebya tangerina TaxID=591198 RepID=UPI000E31D3AB|nr:endonuclease/exonuclease/phosphatase family protein [Euzebya tangerina]